MSIDTIVIIASYVLFFISILIAFWVGYKRGLKRGLLSFGVQAAIIIITFVITPFISKAILNINFSDGKPLSQTIMDLVTQSDEINNIVGTSSALTEFIQAVPLIIINVVVFFILFGIMRLLAYIIYKIIEKCCFKSKKEEIAEGINRHKWWGSLIGVCKGLVFTVLFFAPISALIGFAGDIFNAKSYYTVSESNTASSTLPSLSELKEELPEEVISGIDTYNAHVLGVVPGVLGFDNFIFDQLTKITVDSETVYFRKEILSTVEIYNTISDISKAIEQPSGESLEENLDWDAFNTCVDNLINGGFFKGVVSNVLGAVIKNPDMLDLDTNEFGDIITAISSSYYIGEDDNSSPTTAKEFFSSDLKSIFDIFSSCGKNGLLDELLLKDSFNGISNTSYKETFEGALNNLLDLNMIKSALPKIIDYAASSVAESSATASTSNLEDDIDYISTMLTSAVYDIKIKNSENTLVTEIFNGEDIAKLILKIDPDSCDTLIKSLLHAEILTPFKKILFDTIADTINDMTRDNPAIGTTTITINNNTFKEGTEDQTDEVCKIFKNLIGLLNESGEMILPENGESTTTDAISFEEIGKLLDSIKENAYRKELSSKSNDGIFKDVFDDLYGYLIGQYNDMENIIGEKEPYEISFTSLFKTINSFVNADEDSFVGKLQDIVADEDLTTDKIQEMINAVSADEVDTISNLLDLAEVSGLKIEIPGENEDEINKNKETIKETIEGIDEEKLPDDIKDKIKKFLGITDSQTNGD